MIVLDTDHVSVLQHSRSPQAEQLRQRIRAVQDDVVTTVATYEEQMRSWLSQIARRPDVHDQVASYHRLVRFANFFGRWTLLAFDDHAADIFKQLRTKKIRISSTDLKIGAIVRSNSGTLLSRNLSDFSQIPNLHVENWLDPDIGENK